MRPTPVVEIEVVGQGLSGNGNGVVSFRKFTKKMFAHQKSQTTDNRKRILKAAAEAFSEKGYQASIDEIAARAGVAKQTLYNHFEKKDVLFGEAVKMTACSIIVTVDNDKGNLRENLIQFSEAYCEITLSSSNLAIFRTIVAVAPRFPELAANFFLEGAEVTIRNLAGFLSNAMNCGELRRDDPVFVAEILVSMLFSYDQLLDLTSLESSLLDDAVQRERIVDCFLRIFGT